MAVLRSLAPGQAPVMLGRSSWLFASPLNLTLHPNGTFRDQPQGIREFSPNGLWWLVGSKPPKPFAGPEIAAANQSLPSNCGEHGLDCDGVKEKHMVCGISRQNMRRTKHEKKNNKKPSQVWICVA